MEKLEFVTVSMRQVGVSALRVLVLGLTLLTTLSSAFAQTTDALYVDTSGRVGIGTDSPAAKLHIRDFTSTDAGLQVDNPDGSITQIPSASGHVYLTAPDNHRVYARNYDPVTSTYTYIAMFRTDASYAAKIYGNLLVDSTTYTSSGRWKKNVQTLGNALDAIKALRGVSFEWKEEARNELGYQPRKGGQVGFIAEEVAEVLPEVVMQGEDGKTFDGVDYGKLVPVLVEAVKEQQRQIEALRNEVESLKNTKQP